MRGQLGALVGLMAGVGVWLIIAGVRGVPTETDAAMPRRKPVDWRNVGIRGGDAAAASLLLLALTGWPAAAALGGAAAWIAPQLIGIRRQRTETSARTEALAVWAEMLRDTIAAHAGLREAIATTARVAPAPIRTQVQSLAVRSERGSLSGALRQFATEVADPVGDLVVAALVIASERQAQRLSDLLSQIAASAREQAAMRLRVETGRARTYASARALVVITFGLAVALMAMSPTYMEPYDSFTGQLVLMTIGGLFAGALWGLVQLGKPAATPRLLAGIAGVNEGVLP